MLSSSKRLLYTKVLVVVSVAGSLCTSLTLRAGWGELYPFANWKLFTQPRGSNGLYSSYRIYTLQPGDSVFRRQPVRATRLFNQDDYVYALDYLVNSTLADSTGTGTSSLKLQALVKHLYPGATAYRVVRESTTPQQLLHQPHMYEAETVARF